MGNKKSKVKKPKQNNQQTSGRKGGAMSAEDLGAPQPVRKKKK